MIKSFFTKRALKQYQRKLPKKLKSNYGGSGKSGYTEAQVLTTINELKLNPTYKNFAVLMFCGEQALQNLPSESLLEMTKVIGSLGTGGDADGGYSPYYDSSDSFDGGGADGGGGGE